MYLEVWIDHTKREEVVRKLRKICDEVHEVFYDYDYIVRISKASKEDILGIDGVKKIKGHYNC